MSISPLLFRAWIAILTCALLAIGTARPSHAQDAGFAPVTDTELQNPDPDDWLMWRRTLDSWGYSPLDQINRDNVDTMRTVWHHALRDFVARPDRSGDRPGRHRAGDLGRDR